MEGCEASRHSSVGCRVAGERHHCPMNSQLKSAQLLEFTKQCGPHPLLRSFCCAFCEAARLFRSASPIGSRSMPVSASQPSSRNSVDASRLFRGRHRASGHTACGWQDRVGRLAVEVPRTSSLLAAACYHRRRSFCAWHNLSSTPSLWHAAAKDRGKKTGCGR